MPIPTPKTKQDLATAALQEIRVLRSDEAASGESRVKCDAKYAALYQELANAGRAWWPEDEIPVVVFNPLSMLLANEIKATFGKAYDPGDARRRLIIAAAKPDTGQRARSLYY